MRKSWLVCVLLGALSWGQGAPAPPPPGAAAQAPGMGMAATPPAQPDTSAAVPPTAPVITVKGVCPASAKTTSAKAGTANAASTAAKKPAPDDCKTVITKADFEKLIGGIAPGNVTPQMRRQLASMLPRLIAMSDAAKKKGLENSPRYTETLKYAKMQILTQELNKSIQEDAAKVPPEEIAAYYKEHSGQYEQFNLDRLFVPRAKQPAEAKEPDTDKDEKLTEEQQKAKESNDKAKEEQGEQEMTKLADSLRARAAAGEDFMKLQKEAFEAAGMKIDSPTINLPKLRRTGLPPAHAAVFDLKPGEVSQVISDSGGHYIYKVNSKDQLPLDQVKDEIHNTLQGQRAKEEMDKYQSSFSVETNEMYFGPPGPQGGHQMPPPRMPNPHMAPGPIQPSTAPQNPPQAAPQAPPPAAKPN